MEKWMSSRRPRGAWPTAWDLCMWARLENGGRVSQGTRAFISNSMADNLQNRGANQSDANFGFTAAIAESLLQSHAGEISLLPALPSNWPDGAVEGIKARGGFTVDIRWIHGRLTSATIHNAQATSCMLRYADQTNRLAFRPGDVVRVNSSLRPINQSD